MVSRSRKDSALLLICAMLLCIEIIFLLSQMHVLPVTLPWDGKKTASSVIGEVIQKTKTLKERSTGSLSWYPLTTGDKIAAGSLLMTGEGSSAQIKLEGEGEINVGPSTFIAFGVDRSNPKKTVLELEVEEGSIKLSSKNKTVMVRLKDKKVELKEQTEIVLSQAIEAKNSKIEVSKGELSVISEKEEIPAVLVKQGETIKLSILPEKKEEVLPEEDKTQRTVAMKPEPPFSLHLNSPTPNERIHFETPEQNVEFRWEGEGAERIEISETKEFEFSKKIPVQGGKVEVLLPAGEHFWRLAKDEQLSDVSHFIAMPPASYLLLSPPLESVHRISDSLQFKWQEIPHAKAYSFQISRFSDFRELVIDKKLTGLSENLKGLTEGHYYWRLRAEHDKFGEWPFSKESSFTIKAPLAPPKLKGIRRMKKSQTTPLLEKTYAFLSELFIPVALADEKKITFIVEWEKTDKAVSYQLEIAEDEKFKKKILTKQVKETSTAVEVPERTQYYWRVAGKDKEEDLGNFSLPQIILLSDVTEPEVPKKIEPEVVVVEQPKKVELKPLKPKRKTVSYWGPEALSLGVLGSYLNQSSTGDGISIEQSGLPLGKTELRTAWHFDETSVHLSGWYEPRKITSKNNLPEEFQPTFFYQKQFGARLLWQPPLFSVSLVLGAEFERTVQFERTAVEGVTTKDLNIFSLVLGPVFKWGNKPYLKTSLLLKGSPVGEAKGGEVDVRLDLGYTKMLLGFTPEVNLGMTPSYYSLTLHAQKVSTLRAYFGLSLVWEFTKS